MSRQARAVLGLFVLCASVAPTAADAKTPVAQVYNMTVTQLSSKEFRVTVQNANPKALLTGFWWIPPIGMRVTAVRNVFGGQCSLTGGGVTCKVALAPGTCVRCWGASMSFEVTATGLEGTFVKTSYGGYWIRDAVIGLLKVTSTSSPKTLPYCKKGQVPTKAKPCTET